MLIIKCLAACPILDIQGGIRALKLRVLSLVLKATSLIFRNEFNTKL